MRDIRTVVREAEREAEKELKKLKEKNLGGETKEKWNL